MGATGPDTAYGLDSEMLNALSGILDKLPAVFSALGKNSDVVKSVAKVVTDAADKVDKDSKKNETRASKIARIASDIYKNLQLGKIVSAAGKIGDVFVSTGKQMQALTNATFGEWGTFYTNVVTATKELNAVVGKSALNSAEILAAANKLASIGFKGLGDSLTKASASLALINKAVGTVTNNFNQSVIGLQKVFKDGTAGLIEGLGDSLVAYNDVFGVTTEKLQDSAAFMSSSLTRISRGNAQVMKAMTQDLFKAVSMAESLGIDSQAMGNLLKDAMNMSFGTFADKYATSLSLMGINAADFQEMIQSGDMSGAVAQLITSMQGRFDTMDTNTQNLYKEMMSGMGFDSDMINAIISNSANTEEILKSLDLIETTEGAMADQIGERVMTLGERFQNALSSSVFLAGLQKSLTAIGIGNVSDAVDMGANIMKMSEAMKEPIAGLIKKVGGKGEGITGLIQNIGPILKKFGGKILAVAAIALVAFKTFEKLMANDTFKQAFDMLKEAVMVIVDIVMEIVDSIADVISEVIMKLVEIITKLATALQPVFNLIKDIVHEILPIIQEVFGVILNAIDMLIDPLINVVTTVVNVLQALAEAINPIVLTITRIVNVIIKLLLPIIEVIVRVIGSVLQVIVDVIGRVIGIVSEIFDALSPLINSIMAVLGSIFEIVVEILTGLMPIIDAVFNALKPVLAIIIDIVDTIANTLSQVFDELMPVIQAVFDELMPVIQAVFDELMPVIQAVFDSLVPILEMISGIISGLLSPLVQVLKAVFSILVPLLKPFIEFIKMFAKTFSFVAPLMNFISDIISKIVGGFQAFGNWLADLSIFGWKPFEFLRSDGSNSSPAKIPEVTQINNDTDIDTFKSTHAAGGMTYGFGLTGNGFHVGTDIPMSSGTPLTAVQAGIVTSAGFNGTYGNYASILGNDGIQRVFGHLSRAMVGSGDVVLPGQQIGESGNSGDSAIPHLHYETRENGTFVDPYIIAQRGGDNADVVNAIAVMTERLERKLEEVSQQTEDNTKWIDEFSRQQQLKQKTGY